MAAPKTLRVTSTAFADGDPIPREFTCQGEDVSPPLAVGGVPPGAKSLALIVDDPDAPRGTWTHWTAWDLPSATRTLPRGVDVAKLGGREGLNDSHGVGWEGPCPPSGTHRYFFKVYALAAPLGLPRGAKRPDVERAMADKVLAWGELMGRYAKG